VALRAISSFRLVLTTFDTSVKREDITCHRNNSSLYHWQQQNSRTKPKHGAKVDLHASVEALQQDAG
jgi:hypothetical protein